VKVIWGASWDFEFGYPGFEGRIPPYETIKPVVLCKTAFTHGFLGGFQEPLEQ